MSPLKWFLVVVAIVGIVLFLYAANVYDPVTGWLGVAFVAASIVGLLVLYVYDQLKKKDTGQKS
jgi:membrane-bound ClpP family serine protease